MKKNWLKILILIIIIGAGFFALDFFVFSIKQVSFTVTDTEMSGLSGTGVKIFDSSGNEIQKIAGGQIISLRAGNYTASVTKAGYKQKIGVNVFVQENPTEISVELEKDFDIELEVDDFPSNLVEGQITGFFVTVRNNKQKEEQIDLVFEGALDSRYMRTNYPNPILAISGESRVFIEINLKETIKESLIRDGLKGTIRIRGLNNSKAKKQVVFDLSSFDRRDIRISGTLRFGRVTEGKTGGPKEITITNKLEFDLKDVSFEVDIKGVQFSLPSNVENWFSFDREVPINSIAAGDKTKVGLLVEIPIGEIPFERSSEQETISGKLFIRTSFWEEEVDIDLIAEKSTVKLSLIGISQTISISYDSSLGKFPVQSKILTLKNQGELPLNLINLSATCTTSGNWIPSNIVSFNQTFFTEILASSEAQTSYTLKLPTAANRGDVVNCTINTKYNDPRDNTQRLETQIPFIINIR